jgi:hypothetical protein
VSCNDDHGCAPVLSPSCPARRAVLLTLARGECHSDFALRPARPGSIPPTPTGRAAIMRSSAFAPAVA